MEFLVASARNMRSVINHLAFNLPNSASVSAPALTAACSAQASFWRRESWKENQINVNYYSFSGESLKDEEYGLMWCNGKWKEINLNFDWMVMFSDRNNGSWYH